MLCISQLAAASLRQENNVHTSHPVENITNLIFVINLNMGIPEIQ